MPRPDSRAAVGFRPHLRSSESGNVLILIAVTMTMLLSLAAFSLTLSGAYNDRNYLHAAADYAARVGAGEVFANPSITATALTDAGTRAVKTTWAGLGMNLTAANTPITRRCSDAGAGCASPCTGDSRCVEAVVTQPSANYLAFFPGPITPLARAVAGPVQSINCLVTLGLSAVTWGAGTTVTGPQCGVSVGSALDIGAGSSVTSLFTAVSGTATGGSYTPAARVNIAAPADPLAYAPAILIAPANGAESACPAVNVVNASMTVTPGTYCGFHFTDPTAVLTFAPGEYFITGLVDTATPATDIHITGSGVTLYLQSPDGQLTLDADNVAVTLTAPSTGPRAGIAIMQQKSSAKTMTLGKTNASISITGAVYAPAALVRWKSDAFASTGCTQVVAGSLAFVAGSSVSLDRTCSSFPGGSALKTVTIAE